ncbi:MAG: hypothetical protein KDD62_10510 [Bdellovibrionales bacterium]|nr:hypothetical protein [Bdellovibrionales bacterium]
MIGSLLWKSWGHFKACLLAVFFSCALILSRSTLLSAQAKKLKSVKSLTHFLSKIEQENGIQAQFVTMKLQIYLEDVFISQGTAVRLQSESLSKAIQSEIEKEKSSKEIGKSLLRMYQDGKFDE